MKINEVITESVVDEAQMDSGIKKEMTKQGYKFLGHGQDQDAYLAPDGTILKIFGYETDSRGMSEGQRSFIDFANFCMANSNNPFLPQFGGWTKFHFKGQGYLQIKCERLFEVSEDLGEMLADLVDRIELFSPEQAIERFMHWDVDNDSYPERAGELITMIGGEQQLLLFARTVKQLSIIGRKKGYGIDLHSGNFMLGSDGEIVINDPFFTGSMRH
jgi:hypothetical protein